MTPEYKGRAARNTSSRTDTPTTRVEYFRAHGGSLSMELLNTQTVDRKGVGEPFLRRGGAEDTAPAYITLSLRSSTMSRYTIENGKRVMTPEYKEQVNAERAAQRESRRQLYVWLYDDKYADQRAALPDWIAVHLRTLIPTTARNTSSRTSRADTLATLVEHFHANGGTLSLQQVFQLTELGRAEMRNLCAYAVNQPPEDRVWISFDEAAKTYTLLESPDGSNPDGYKGPLPTVR